MLKESQKNLETTSKMNLISQKKVWNLFSILFFYFSLAFSPSPSLLLLLFPLSLPSLSHLSPPKKNKKTGKQRFGTYIQNVIKKKSSFLVFFLMTNWIPISNFFFVVCFYETFRRIFKNPN